MDEKVLNALPGCLGAFAFGAIVITWVVETVLSAMWHKKYFTVGVPLFIFRVPVKIHHTNIPSCLALENRFKSSGLIKNSSLLFQEIDTNTVGFRETLLQLGRWYSVMHGLLIFDDQNKQVVVKGFFDWTCLCFSLMWLIVPPLIWLLGLMFGFISWGDPIFGEPVGLVALGYFGILLVNMGFFCSMDYFRFSEVAKFAAQEWSRKYVFSGGGV